MINAIKPRARKAASELIRKLASILHEKNAFSAVLFMRIIMRMHVYNNDHWMHFLMKDSGGVENISAEQQQCQKTAFQLFSVS